MLFFMARTTTSPLQRTQLRRLLNFIKYISIDNERENSSVAGVIISICQILSESVTTAIITTETS